MLLYRIRNKETGKYFAGVRWYDGKITWTEHGAFYRTPDSIHKHIKYMCSELVVRKNDGFPRHTRYGEPRRNQYSFKEVKKKIRFYKKYLKLYQVVIDDVNCIKRKRIEAEVFLGTL